MLPSTLTTNSYISRPLRIYGSIDSVPIQDTILYTTYIDGFQTVPMLKVVTELLICRGG